MNKNSEYEKMPKSLKGLNLSEKSQHELNKLKWVVTEKIHGANFSFVYENHRLLYAKRKDYLQWTDDFFGFQLVAARLEDSIIRVFEQLAQDIPASRYIIYGELFGGRYPHPDVVADPQFQAIQTGVYYSPVVDFCAFDIAMENDDTGAKQYLDYARSVAYFEEYSIFHAKILFSGKLNEALNFNTRINSAVPAQLQLPTLDNNLIEGIVVKPLQHMGLTEMDIRPIIKIKNPEFDEEKKFHEAEKWSLIPEVTSRAEKLSFLVEEMSGYITENRLNSVLSKTGRADKANTTRMNEIKAEFLRDVYEDFNLDNAGILDDLSEAEARWIRDRIAMRIVGLLNSFS
ncbi:RNA ligase family protein [Chitinophaga sp. Cy-1792]|uniref:RNA ligase family protein n=1 Tax=Chitinophaga sp. Cy-1792 TaxID=2608339 RepID=UPI001424A000|nr:RNA ligase family protein [Chitinophaga sp. Cy-1792]NIG55742.1 2'-5' RNA ligase [Chitinophaga sp. Cy-1792]